MPLPAEQPLSSRWACEHNNKNPIPLYFFFGSLHQFIFICTVAVAMVESTAAAVNNYNSFLFSAISPILSLSLSDPRLCRPIWLCVHDEKKGVIKNYHRPFIRLHCDAEKLHDERAQKWGKNVSQTANNRRWRGCENDGDGFVGGRRSVSAALTLVELTFDTN